MKHKWIIWTSFLLGLGSSLFVPTPFGRVAMFDLVAYVLGPILFAKNYKSFTKTEARLLILSALWFLGACYSNWWRGEEFEIALKGSAIVFNVMCMLIVIIILMKQSYRVFLWFCVGAAISGFISLYVFQNGSYLSYAESYGYTGTGGVHEFLEEKQIYPIYAAAIYMGFFFPLRSIGFIPWTIVFVGCISGSFILLFWGGSRSGFGVMFLTALTVIGYAYFRTLLQLILRNLLLIFVVMSLLVALTFQAYKHFAQSGALGEAEYKKYYSEIVDSDAGILGSRDDLIRAWPFLKNHPLVGAGSSATDRWGYIQEDFKIPGHSALVGAWAQNGIAGLIFWVYALYNIFLFIRERMVLFGDWVPFMAYQIFSMIWAILFSPFGGCRGMICMVLALCVVSSSHKVIEQVKFDLLRKKLNQVRD